MMESGDEEGSCLDPSPPHPARGDARCTHALRADGLHGLASAIYNRVRLAKRVHSVMMRSAHSTRPTKMAGLPNFAPHSARSASVTPRAREQARQAKTGMCLAMIFPRVSVSGGQPTGTMAPAVALRIR